jgi:hypothetical protein
MSELNAKGLEAVARAFISEYCGLRPEQVSKEDIENFLTPSHGDINPAIPALKAALAAMRPVNQETNEPKLLRDMASLINQVIAHYHDTQFMELLKPVGARLLLKYAEAKTQPVTPSVNQEMLEALEIALVFVNEVTPAQVGLYTKQTFTRKKLEQAILSAAAGRGE